MKKIFSIVMITFILVSQLFSLKDIAYSEESQTRDPYLSFKVNPNPIGSMQLVSLNVGIDSSFGELPNPSKICFDVPSVLIRQSSDFQNQQLPDYLTWLSTEDDGVNTHVCYELDTTGQQYFTFSIQFTSALLLEGAVESSYDFKSTLNDTVISKDTVLINPGTTGDPHFAKFRKFATDPVDGLGLLDLNYPNYNMYELVFNRDFSGEFQNVIIQDQLAAGTKLDESFPGWSEIPGNRVSVNGLRIYQIDVGIPSGQENRKYVTEEFLDAIVYDDKTEVFKVDLGIVPQNISYVVQYAVEVTDGSLGTYTNTATLTKAGSNAITKKSTEKIKSNGSGKGFFEKAVDKTEITLPDRDLTYNLKVGGVGYTLPSGTIFFDYLPEGVVFKAIQSDNNKTFELVSVEGNKVTFKTTKELVNYTENLFFDVSYEGNSFPETLNNTAYIEKDTGTYYSNTVSTLVKRNQSAVLTKKDDVNGQGLQGAKFNLYSESDELVRENLITDENGTIVVDQLAPGAYKFIETEAPDGYILDETPVEFEITTSQLEPIQVTKTNKKIEGEAILTKKDDVNGQGLQGAKFNLYSESDELVRENLITDENGTIVVDQLAPGVYKFIETEAPDGYILDETPVEFEITTSQLESIQVTKTNKKIEGEAILTKKDDVNGQGLQGAKFNLYSESDELLRENLITDENGTIVVDQLAPGAYKFIETVAPDGYILDETPVEFEITTSQIEPIQVIKTNKKIVNKVILKKTANTSNGQRLEGAVFKLVDINGKELENRLSTNQEGEIIVENLEPGVYQFIEVKAPKGYELDSTPVSFVITNNQIDTLMLNKVNKKNSEDLEVGSSVENPNTSNSSDSKKQNRITHKIPALGESSQSILLFSGFSLLFISLILIMGKNNKK
ncbi:SpaA isopeptide-forming pilin-related protein [Carnobacterium maltaromaticum]|uniref:MSCRAMM family protein n=1 Tax=Carnobacterium maltaromaticum TaxID=2751 RepID=UPI00298BA56A|nr:SpaA isopeptide-forming pilin-related protein [Carnobacterium maltaromaticum]MDW5523893.1 SpaA isopeptide-forming pilin-related protein [Carnobacterium maltaromaticum]